MINIDSQGGIRFTKERQEVWKTKMQTKCAAGDVAIVNITITEVPKSIIDIAFLNFMSKNKISSGIGCIITRNNKFTSHSIKSKEIIVIEKHQHIIGSGLEKKTFFF